MAKWERRAAGAPEGASAVNTGASAVNAGPSAVNTGASAVTTGASIGVVGHRYAKMAKWERRAAGAFGAGGRRAGGADLCAGNVSGECLDVY